MPDQTAQICSRIFHDLASPLGAISAGIELAAMSGPLNDEHLLMSDSAKAALLKLSFFRWAFGNPGGGSVSTPQLKETLAGIAPKVEVQGLPSHGISARDAKILALGVGFCSDRRAVPATIIYDDAGDTTVVVPGKISPPSDEDASTFGAFLFDQIVGGFVRSAQTQRGLEFTLQPVHL
ncbi:MAG: hypothetical protein AAF826_07525 [Pseudomonadota bacterium]